MSFSGRKKGGKRKRGKRKKKKELRPGHRDGLVGTKLFRACSHSCSFVCGRGEGKKKKKEEKKKNRKNCHGTAISYTFS